MMDLDKFRGFMLEVQPEPVPMPETQTFQYDFFDGKGPVCVTVEECARRVDVDPDILADYIARYDGNFPLAVLASLNDKQQVRTYTFLTKLFVPDVLHERPLKDMIPEVNRYLNGQRHIQRQLEYGTAFHKSSTPSDRDLSAMERIVLLDTQLELLMFGRCVNEGAFLSQEEFHFVRLLSRISAMSGQERRDLSQEDSRLLEKFLDESSIRLLLSVEANLPLSLDAAKVVLELCEKKTTRAQNLIFYERLREAGE